MRRLGVRYSEGNLELVGNYLMNSTALELPSPASGQSVPCRQCLTVESCRFCSPYDHVEPLTSFDLECVGDRRPHWSPVRKKALNTE